MLHVLCTIYFVSVLHTFSKLPFLILYMQAHWDLLITLGKALLTEQALEHFGMADVNDEPTKNQPPADISTRSHEDQMNAVKKMLGGLLQEYQYGCFQLDVVCTSLGVHHFIVKKAKCKCQVNI